MNMLSQKVVIRVTLAGVAMTGLIVSAAHADAYIEINFKSKTSSMTGYVVRNPNVTVEQCKEVMNSRLVSQLLKSAPSNVPRDAEITGWTCHARPPK